jgi:hypothetical protein
VQAPARTRRCSGEMDCAHDGYHALRSSYDRREGVLVFFWTCESCGARLREASREEYRPQFDPRGNDPYLSAPAA